MKNDRQAPLPSMASLLSEAPEEPPGPGPPIPPWPKQGPVSVLQPGLGLLNTSPDGIPPVCHRSQARRSGLTLGTGRAWMTCLAKNLEITALKTSVHFAHLNATPMLFSVAHRSRSSYVCGSF